MLVPMTEQVMFYLILIFVIYWVTIDQASGNRKLCLDLVYTFLDIV